MKIKKETLTTIVMFYIIFMIAISVIKRAEHQEQIKLDKKLLRALENNSNLRTRYIKQMEVVEKGQIKTNELLKYQNKLLEKR